MKLISKEYGQSDLIRELQSFSTTYKDKQTKPSKKLNFLGSETLRALREKYNLPANKTEFLDRFKPVIEPSFIHDPKHAHNFNYIGIDDEDRLAKNPYLRKASSKIHYTKEMLHEWIQCRDNPIYFIETYCFIDADTNSGLQRFLLWDFQKEIIQAIQSGKKFVAANVARQMGKTSLAAAYILWDMLFHARRDIGIISLNEGQSIEILSRVSSLLFSVPDFLKGGVVNISKTHLEIDNGSKVRAFSSSADSCRGKKFSFTYIDEVAYIDNWDDTWRTLKPIIDKLSRQSLLTSTPVGNNHWKAICDDDSDLFYHLNYDWLYCPDNLYSRKTGKFDGGKQFKADNGKNPIHWRSEYEISFSGSTHTLIDAKTLGELREKPYTIERVANYDYRCFLAPESLQRDSGQYVLSVDLAAGVGHDYLAMTVIDVEKGEIAATFRHKYISDYMVIANIIRELSETYNYAFVVIEKNHDLASDVLSMITRENSLEYNGIYKDPVKKTFGIWTDKSKIAACLELKTWIEEHGFKINCPSLIDELNNFVKHKQSYSADNGKHDDLVMTLVIFVMAFLRDENQFIRYFDNIIVEEMKNDMSPTIQRELYARALAYSAYGCGVGVGGVARG